MMIAVTVNIDGDNIIVNDYTIEPYDDRWYISDGIGYVSTLEEAIKLCLSTNIEKSIRIFKGVENANP